MQKLVMGALGLALLTIGALGLSGEHAGAEPNPADGNVEVFDVRVVRVVTALPEEIEKPCPILSGSDTTTAIGWTELMAALKKRGATQVLMDQRVTGTAGQRVQASEERQVPIIAPQSRTRQGPTGPTKENLAAARIRTGCKAQLTTQGGPSKTALLQYQLEVRGVLPSTSNSAEGPTETLNTWEGSHPSFAKRTLVLTHRQQIRDPGVASAQGVELYCFVTRH